MKKQIIDGPYVLMQGSLRCKKFEKISIANISYIQNKKLTLFQFIDYPRQETNAYLLFNFLVDKVQKTSDLMTQYIDEFKITLEEAKAFIRYLSERFGVNADLIIITMLDRSITIHFQLSDHYIAGNFIPIVCKSVHEAIIGDRFNLIARDTYDDGLHSTYLYVGWGARQAGTPFRIQWCHFQDLSAEDWQKLLHSKKKSNEMFSNSSTVQQSLKNPWFRNDIQRLLYSKMLKLIYDIINHTELAAKAHTGFSQDTNFHLVAKRCSFLVYYLTTKPSGKISVIWEYLCRICRCFSDFGEQVMALYYELHIKHLREGFYSPNHTIISKVNIAPPSCKDIYNNLICTKKNCGVLHPAELSYTTGQISYQNTIVPLEREMAHILLTRLRNWLIYKYKCDHIYSRDIHRQYDKAHSPLIVRKAIKAAADHGVLIPVTPVYKRPRGKKPTQLFLINRPSFQSISNGNILAYKYMSFDNHC